MNPKNSKNESYYTREICKNLTRVGCKIDAIVGSRMNKSGRPDRYVAHLDWDGWLEMKKDGKKLSSYQKEWHTEQQKRRPGTVFVVDIYPDKDKVILGHYLASENRVTEHFVFSLNLLINSTEQARSFIQCLRELHFHLANQYSDDRARLDGGSVLN